MEIKKGTGLARCSICDGVILKGQADIYIHISFRNEKHFHFLCIENEMSRLRKNTTQNGDYKKLPEKNQIVNE